MQNAETPHLAIVQIALDLRVWRFRLASTVTLDWQVQCGGFSTDG